MTNRFTQSPPRLGNTYDEDPFLQSYLKRTLTPAARSGLIAIPYERRHARNSRIHEFAAVYLLHPSSDLYTCPLAMTDSAASTLVASGNTRLIAPMLTVTMPGGLC